MDALLRHDIELACKDGKLKCSSTLLAMASPVLEPAIGLLKDSQDKVLAMPDGTAVAWTVIRDHVDPRMPFSQKAALSWVGGHLGCRVPPSHPLHGAASSHGLPSRGSGSDFSDAAAMSAVTHGWTLTARPAGYRSGSGGAGRQVQHAHGHVCL